MLRGELEDGGVVVEALAVWFAWASVAFFLFICSFFCHESLQSFDLDAAADDEGSALVDGFGLEVEDALCAVGGGAAGLLGDEGERVGFVEQTELAFGVLFASAGRGRRRL